MQGEREIVDRNGEVQFAVSLNWRGQQLIGWLGDKLNVGDQLRDINVFWRQSGAQHVVRVSHYLQRHTLQVGVWGFGK